MKRLIIMALSAAALFSCASPQTEEGLYQNNRSPLVHKPYMELPLGAVKPDGWLRDQLLRQASGMTGHLDQIVPNIMGDRNGWLGGDGDKWERGPYWIDGLVPLAYILDDQTLKDKAQRWIEWTLSSQQENGFFGPSEDLPNVDGLQRDRTHDWWPRIVVLKFLQQYYDATGDPRVISFMTNYFRYQLERLPEEPLGQWSYWAVERGADNIMVVYWLYNITGDAFLLDLGKLLAQQTAPWKDRLSDHSTLFTRYALHCVNLAQGFKAPVIEYQGNGDKSYVDAVITGYEDLMKQLGWPNGMYGSDELLHSGSPTQGSEFCSAVELMFSLERMIEITGRTDLADWLEKVAYNALPTQATDAFDARQYYQQLNQVEVSRQMRNFMTSYNGTEGTFGPLTGFPCCTANMHQGWPKFVRDLWFASADSGLAAMYYGPCTVTAKVADGTVVTISESGGYPFSEAVQFRIEALSSPAVFPLHLRVPGWCETGTVKVNGVEVASAAGGETLVVNREWSQDDQIELVLPLEIKVTRWYENSAAIERGPLVFALKMKENWTKVANDGKFGTRYGDWYYEVHSKDAWNFALLREDVEGDAPKQAFTLEEMPTDAYPWNVENAPLQIKARARMMNDWKPYGGSTGPLPYSDQYQADLGPVQEITLIPYGCTTLRITEFPVTY